MDPIKEDPDLEKLVALVRTGDRHAYSEIVRLLQQRVFRYCYPMLGNRQDAEDAVQETFVRAFEQLGRYREQGRFPGWLFTIAYRICLNKLKQRGRDRALVSRLTRERTAETPSRQLATLQEGLSLLDTLKPKLRSVVILRVLHDMSYEEMSCIIGTSPAALRKRYERARKQLRCSVGDEAESWKRGVKYEG